MKWKRFNGSLIDGEITEEVERTIINEKNSGHKLTVCVGTDSQVRGATTEFATVIVFIREKKGGFMYIQKDKTFQEMGIKERMIKEVSKSIAVAFMISEILNKHELCCILR